MLEVTQHAREKSPPIGIVGIAFALSGLGMGALKQQFFPTSDRPEVLVEVRLPEGASIETTTATVAKLEQWLAGQPGAKIITSYVGQGAPRFFFAMAPELPDSAFAKIVVLTPDEEARETLKHRLREAVSQGLAPEAHVRVTQLVFGPYTPFPVEFRVMGPDPAQLYSISEKALDIMRGVPDVRQANRDWGNRTPVLRFVPDQDRLNLIGLSSSEVGQQLYHAVIEATVQRTRPVILTALAAVLAFIPLTHSVFWGSMAYTLIGGTAIGTVLILLFLPALYVTWFRINR
jgi:multidrug efflux pump subunit AcrB